LIVSIVEFALAASACLLVLPVAVLFGEVVAAVARPRRKVANGDGGTRPSVVVLVPAHDEAIGILPTLEGIKAQLGPKDRLVVVADNCSDDTGVIAAGAGAEVAARFDADRVGKGYALDFGIRHIGADPRDVMIIIDADCRLGEGAIERLATMCAARRQPVQALYLMEAPADEALNHRVAAFAWRVKNWVRPLGLSALGLPCQLMGTGMAFPFHVIRSAELASGEIVEDLKLGLDLAAAGHPPAFCPDAIVASTFPATDAGARTQRERWEQGHISLIISSAPRLLLSALKRRDLQVLALALDLAVPPTALLTLLLMAALAISALAALAGFSALAFHLSAAAFLALVASVVLAWWVYGRTVLPTKALLSLPAYLWEKGRLYARLSSGRRPTQWIRTDRQ
jgi:cellulose synthase/poly-beta-1,6-N-acetylglucosamine synthase-like glycosyltransferase